MRCAVVALVFSVAAVAVSIWLCMFTILELYRAISAMQLIETTPNELRVVL